MAEGFRTPAAWSVPENQGVAWKTPIAGLGHSSPTIWGDRVCVTTAIGGNEDTAFRKLTDADKAKDAPRVQTTMDGSYPAAAVIPITDPKPLEWRVICLDKRSGKVAWQQTAHTGVPAIGRHEKSTQANATLATDGTHLVAFFGSEGLYLLSAVGRTSDVEEIVWRARFRILGGSVVAMGIRELAGHSRRAADPPRRRSERLLPGLSGCDHRERSLADAAT